MMRTRILLSCVVLFFTWVAVLPPTRAFPQAVIDAPLPVEELLSARTFAWNVPIDFSPNDDWIAYTLQDNRRKEPLGDERYRIFSRAGVCFFGIGGDIWVTNTKSGLSENVTGGQGSNWSPAWSPDGRYVAFYSDRGGQANVWVWEKATGKLRQVSKAIVRAIANPIQWTLDSRRVVVKLLPEGMTLENAASFLAADQEQIRNEKKVPGSSVMVYSSPKAENQAILKTKAVSSQSPPLNLMHHLADLAVMDIASGQIKRVVRGNQISKYWLSPDGSSIAYTTPQTFGTAGSHQTLFDVGVFSFSTGESHVVASNIQFDSDGSYVSDGSSVSWSPDGKMLAFRTAGPLAKGDIFIVPATGGEPRNLTAAPHPSFAGYGLQPPLWDAAGQNVYFIGSNELWKASLAEGTASRIGGIPDRRIALIIPKDGNRLWSQDNGQSTIVRVFDDRRKQDGFYKVNLVTGQSVGILEKGKIAHSVSVSNDGRRITYLAEDTQHGADLWLVDADSHDPQRLTRINPHLERYRMGMARLIEWNSLDGQRLRGALLLPAGYKEGRRYPLITKVYGGAFLSEDLNRFGCARFSIENFQLLATRDYAVLLPDSPSQVGTPMVDLLKTVVPGVNKVVEMGIADPDRLGVMGHSNGGYSALALLVQTKQFKAAIMISGHGNMLGEYGQLGKDGATFGLAVLESIQMGGTPWEYRERYVENSPLFYLDRVQTPLLLMHGAEDTAVPSFLSDEIFVGLRRLGKEVEYAKYEREGHSRPVWGYVNQVDYLSRIIDWFDKHLKDDQELKSGDKHRNLTR